MNVWVLWRQGFSLNFVSSALSKGQPSSKHMQPITEEPYSRKADLGAHQKIKTTEAEVCGWGFGPGMLINLPWRLTLIIILVFSKVYLNDLLQIHWDAKWDLPLWSQKPSVLAPEALFIADRTDVVSRPSLRGLILLKIAKISVGHTTKKEWKT